MRNEAATINKTPISPQDTFRENPQLGYFWEIPQEQRLRTLQDAILKSHNWHFLRNPSYRQTVSARGVDEQITVDKLQLLLRPTAQTFKSYIDIIETPFPQDKPVGFMRWMINQLSIQLPEEPLTQLQSRYKSLEGLLADIELLYQDFGLEVITSSGTSGRSTIMVRDNEGIC
jgi:predicted metalloenzyme YecM